MTTFVATAPHEFVANYLFDGAGLAPYFACHRRLATAEESVSGEFVADGERWTVTMVSEGSGFLNPGERLPSGTAFEPDSVDEFRLSVQRHPDEDPIGRQSFSVNVSPRWEGLEYEKAAGDRGELPQPEGLDEGVNLRASGANIEFDRYLLLIRRAFAAVDVNDQYFEERYEDGELVQPHPYSNVQDAERRVRLDADRSGPIHGRTGPLAKMARLLESDREGYCKLVRGDTDGHGRSLSGYYHTVTLDDKRVQEVFPSHDLPKGIKHYHAREALAKSAESPLRHPKLGASYQVSRWDGTLGVSEAEIEKLDRELTTAVLSVMADAGLQVHPGPSDPFVEDAYFSVERREYEEDPLVSLDLSRIEQQQEAVVIRHLSRGFTPVEWETVEYLLDDGGGVSPADVAEETGRHVDSVRRAIRRLPELFEASYGDVRLRSDHVADLLVEAVREARSGSSASDESDDVDGGESHPDPDTSPFVAWAARNGIDVVDGDEGRLRLRMASVDDVERQLNEGYRLWRDAGRDVIRYRQAEVDLGDRGLSTVWHWL